MMPMLIHKLDHAYWHTQNDNYIPSDIPRFPAIAQRKRNTAKFPGNVQKDFRIIVSKRT
jgi:hypothetical protein